MMPCALIDSASSYSAPSSMRVRGWYAPGTRSSSRSEAGSPALAPPSPSPASPPVLHRGAEQGFESAAEALGFFGDHDQASRRAVPRQAWAANECERGGSSWSFLQECLQQRVALGPVAQAGVGIDMAARADGVQRAAPLCGEHAGMRKTPNGSSELATTIELKRQGLTHDRRPARQLLAQVVRSTSGGATSKAPLTRWVLREWAAQAATWMQPRLCATSTAGASRPAARLPAARSSRRAAGASSRDCSTRR
jgi:hypothetical protein